MFVYKRLVNGEAVKKKVHILSKITLLIDAMKVFRLLAIGEFGIWK